MRVIHRVAVLAGAAALAASVASEPFHTAASGAPSAEAARDEAFATVNAYRAMSGLAPIAADATWDAEARAHSCYQLQHGITHDEVVGAPGYSPGGAEAGRSGNVAVSTDPAATATDHVELWMTGPFHAIGLLRPNLVRSGFGVCSDPHSPTQWRSAATMDVVRGIDPHVPWPETPVLFPGDGATVPLRAFVTEQPDPLAECGWQAPAGLPLIVMFPAPVAAATAALAGPDGSAEVCVLHAGVVSDPSAAAVLDSANAVVVVPRGPLAAGVHTATVTTEHGPVTWSFHVDPDRVVGGAPGIDLGDTRPLAGPSRFAPSSPFRLVDTRIGLGAGRLGARQVVVVDTGNAEATAISANFVAVAPDGPGYLTLFECGGVVPTVSQLGFTAGEVVANQAIVPLTDGRFCVFASAATDVVIDVNGYFSAGSRAGFVAVPPTRVLDSRPAQRLRAGEQRRVRVAGSVVPVGAAAVALGVVAVDPAGAGHLSVTPCGEPGPDRVSSINYVAGDLRTNVVVSPTDPSGAVCIRSVRDTDVVVDVTGYFVDAGPAFTPLSPLRLLDTRQPGGVANPFTAGARLAAGETLVLPVAGGRGVPADAVAVAVNVTVTDAAGASWVRAFPCGTPASTSTVNVPAGRPVASSGALVGLSGDGALCLESKANSHVIVDIVGVWRGERR